MKKALVVCSTVGSLSLDEMTPCGPTQVSLREPLNFEP
jgi:anthranilate phosphoribosyltransferase